MAKRSEPPEPFRAVELPHGSDPISKGVVQRVRRDGETVIVDDRRRVVDDLEQDCGSLLDEVETEQTGTTGVLLELTRT